MNAYSFTQDEVPDPTGPVHKRLQAALGQFLRFMANMLHIYICKNILPLVR